MKELYRFRQFLAEGVIKEDISVLFSDGDEYDIPEFWDKVVKELNQLGYDIKVDDVNNQYHVSKDGDYLAIIGGRKNEFTDLKNKKSNIPWQGVSQFINSIGNTADLGDRKEVKGMLRGQELLDFFSFTKYMNIDVEELESEFEDAMNYGQFTDPANVEQDKKDFTYENGDRFLDTNEDKMSEYLGFEIDTEQMTDDYFLGDPKAVEFVHSDEDFEGWMDEIGSFWR
jgi:hypothetical protein